MHHLVDDDHVIVIDNGGGNIRAGPATESVPRVVEPNCTAAAKGQGGKSFSIGADVFELPSYALYRTTQRGLLLDPEQQRTIWDFVLRKRLRVDPRECAVLLTEAPFTPPSVRHEVKEILFETFGFREVSVLAAPALAMHSPKITWQLGAQNPCCTVLNVGYSSSVALPCVEGRVLHSAGRRLNVGGRVLTNLMVERLKLRHYDLTNSWLLAEDIVERVCEVSPDFDGDLRNGFADVAPKTYVLPDFQTCRRGFLETDPQPPGTQASHESMQRVTLAAERVAVPEALFSPKDHGIMQAGVAELVQQAILAVEEKSWQPHFGQVVVCGGVARLPFFCRRLYRELRQLLPTSWPVSVVVEDAPELSVWRGAARLALSPEFRQCGFQSRRSWEEERDGKAPGGAGGAKR